MVKTVGIVSLSSGILGEPFVAHEVKLGLRRLDQYGLKVKFADHARKGIDYLKEHPEKRAADLLQMFRDPEIDMILCAIGGDDTYRLLPYLFEHDELKKAVNNKIFLGFSDTTINHLMLHKVGLKTFYGQAFLPDICELNDEMLPYTKQYFEELIKTGTISRISASDSWYTNRTDFSESQLGVKQQSHSNRGFELLQGTPVFSGEILGGCIDSLFEMFDGSRYADMPVLCKKYGLFPDLEAWQGKILLLESSEELMPPEKYRKALQVLKETGIFSVINGVLVGKPMDETWYEAYKAVLMQELGETQLPVVYNLSVGHALPRCIVPFGIMATVVANQSTITFAE